MDSFVKILNSKLKRKSTVIIKSLEKCQEQSPHTDYILDNNLLSLEDNEIPLAMLLALQDNTKLNVWIGSIKKYNKTINKTIVNLNKGDILIFRADFIHAGSEYIEENIRLHSFLDNPKIKRRRNATNVINDENKFIIE